MEKKRQIVNIVNFIRAVEPRGNVSLQDLLEVVREQISLMKKHALRGTFLVQYDALLEPAFTEMLKELDPCQFELGVWLEIVEPQVTQCGIPWTGRYPWDWHVHCGFSLGYDNKMREQLADALFERFKAVFGYYPRVLGSWLFDTHTILYLSEKYGLDAVCNCKEQYGTDGYTLWGGYYGQGYYPSKQNVFMPAQTAEQQMDVPLFRMLGSDPVYQYDMGVNLETGADVCQKVITLEPVYSGGSGGGGNPVWVDWYLRENYNGECLSFGYAQAGQENSFTWPRMKDGLIDQFAKMAQKQSEGLLTAEPLGETGRWFKSAFSTTPASTITAHTAWDDEHKCSAWYCSKNYRINIYRDNAGLRIRDLYLFDENMPDPYENVRCPGNTAVYESLSVVDGNRFTGNGILAGLFVESAANFSPMHFQESEKDTAEIAFDDCRFLLQPDSVSIRCNSPLQMHIGHKADAPEVIDCTDDLLTLRRHGRTYRIRLTMGHFEGACHLCPVDGIIKAVFENAAACKD